MPLVDIYALVNSSIISEALNRGEGVGVVGVGTGNGLFITSAMLGARFSSTVEGVGG